jgi:outer membrane receptor protein involved in Fe transport
VGGYAMVDARLSFSRSHWRGTAYVNNLTNQLGINSYSDPFNYGDNYQAVVSTPRTVGVTLGYSLKEQ